MTAVDSSKQIAIMSHVIIKNIGTNRMVFKFKLQNDLLLKSLHIVKFHHLQSEMPEVLL